MMSITIYGMGFCLSTTPQLQMMSITIYDMGFCLSTTPLTLNDEHHHIWHGFWSYLFTDRYDKNSSQLALRVTGNVSNNNPYKSCMLLNHIYNIYTVIGILFRNMSSAGTRFMKNILKNLFIQCSLQIDHFCDSGIVKNVAYHIW